MSPEQVPSAETRFSIKMWRVQGLTSAEASEYRVMTVGFFFSPFKTGYSVAAGEFTEDTRQGERYF